MNACHETKTFTSVSYKTGRNIVLDIDHTLANTFDSGGSSLFTDLLNSPDQLEVRRRVYVLQFEGYWMWGVKRPYLYAFLKYCFEEFDQVIVWTAGTKEYADAIVPWLFDSLPMPHKVYSRDDCVVVGGDYTKPLLKILDSQIRLDNTLFVDDNAYYMRYNKGNAIIIGEYSPRETLEDINVCDQSLLDLRFWLSSDSVRKAKDVRTLDKSKIFSHLLN